MGATEDVAMRWFADAAPLTLRRRGTAVRPGARGVAGQPSEHEHGAPRVQMRAAAAAAAMAVLLAVAAVATQGGGAGSTAPPGSGVAATVGHHAVVIVVVVL